MDLTVILTNGSSVHLTDDLLSIKRDLAGGRPAALYVPPEAGPEWPETFAGNSADCPEVAMTAFYDQNDREISGENVRTVFPDGILRPENTDFSERYFRRIAARCLGEPWILCEDVQRKLVVREFETPDVKTINAFLSGEKEITEEILEKHRQDCYLPWNLGRFGVFLDGELAGMISLERCSDEDACDGDLELGYILKEEFRGRGIMTFACGQVMDYVREEWYVPGFSCVLRIAPNNQKSLSLARRLTGTYEFLNIILTDS